MIGLLFHGPEVFDTGWAEKVIDAVSPLGEIRCVLAGTMGRTAVFDCGLEGIEFWEKMPGACLKDLAQASDLVLLVNSGKSVESGLVFGGMVVERSGIAQAVAAVPVIQIECSGPFFVVWRNGASADVIKVFAGLGLAQRPCIEISPSVWQENGAVYRRMTTADAGDFVLVDGIMVGRATGEDVVLGCQNGHIFDVRGVDVKAHGIEKLDRLGGVDLERAKLASTPAVRRSSYSPRTIESPGNGVVFLDHAGMHVYELARGARGVVTVGDDTTVVAADILSRFNIPVIGIVDGDEDVVLKNGCFARGSVRLTVQKDDEFGLEVLDKVFNGKTHIDKPFKDVLDRIVDLVGTRLIEVEYK